VKPRDRRSNTGPPLTKRPRHVQRAYDVYGNATFFDERIKKRTIQVAVDKMARPARSLGRSSRGKARAKGAHRIVGNYKLRSDQKRKERVTKGQLWTPVYEHAAESSRNEELVYVPQDSSCFMFPTLKATTGLGTADRKKEEALWMHSAIGIRPDGYVLGVYHAHFWARPLSEFGKGKDRKTRPFEEKESYLWVQTANAVEALFREKGIKAEIIHIEDRAGDVHEVLQEHVETGKRFVIRSARNRKVEEEEGYLVEQLAKQAVLDTRTITIPRTREHPEREAILEVRSCRVTIHPPASGPNRGSKRPFQVNVVSVHEPSPPEDAERIDWVLYTSEPVETAEDCWEVVRIYKLRWRIEEHHRVLKTDCHAEETQLKDADAIIRLLAFLTVAAIRILQLRERARTNPAEPCTIVLEDHEWKVLWLLFHEEPPPCGQDPPTVGEAVKMIGHLGGHWGRKGDGMPGSESLALGLRELEIAANVYRLLNLEL